MKTLLKELKFDNLKFTNSQINMGTIYNLTDPLEFQIPTVKIILIDTDYITLQLLPTRACQIFVLKIHEFEQKLKEIFNQEITSLFENDTFRLKINLKNFKIYFEDRLFNIYDLKPEMNIIALITINKLWENVYKQISYTLHIKELLLKTQA
jgi:hypothetical protein